MIGRVFNTLMVALAFFSLAFAMSMPDGELEPSPVSEETPFRVSGNNLLRELPKNPLDTSAQINESDCDSCESQKTVCPDNCCTKNWYPCSASKRCCSLGWRCVNWKYGKRCEPPCVKNWYRCDRGNSYCCGGWRCKNWKYGKRCEP